MTLATNIPIVFINPGNPIGPGLVASLAHPGGNVTGVATLSGSLFAIKALEVLRQMVPTLVRVGVFLNPPQNSLTAEFMSGTAAMSLQVRALEVRAEADVDVALEAAFAWPAEAFLYSVMAVCSTQTPPG